jgi:tRNA-2-methylthio-N6-dimethylallyladenosine synthase
MPSVYIKTYGCQMNERDSEQVARDLQNRGYSLVDDEKKADVILINTCSVRDQAEQKALGKMGMMKNLKKSRPDLILGFMGCMAQSRGPELIQRLPDLDLVVGTQKYHRVADFIEEIKNQFRRTSILDTAEESGSQSKIKDHFNSSAPQATAYVSIMQGCDMFCTYCIVPHTRGRERGRPIPEILNEVRELVERGVREVTLLGQIVNLYGRHEFPIINGMSPFVQLLYALQNIDGLERIRFTSPHPAGLKDDLMRAYAELPKLCEHMHLPVQSGNNRILRAMHRSYTREIYLRKVEKLRQHRPDIAVTTDIIVGFPGETEEEFQDTVSLVREVGFDNAFVFRYSERKDTPAAGMSNQVPEQEKERRNQELLAVVNSIAHAKNATLVGTVQEILVEGPSKTTDQRYMGRTRQNKIVVFPGSERHRGKLLPVRIERSTGFTLYGDPVIHE